MDPARLKADAGAALAAGEFSRAASLYAAYCASAPRDRQSHLRLGDAWARAGDDARAIDAYLAAAQGFAEDGFLARAIAASKRVMALDPNHTRMQRDPRGPLREAGGGRAGAPDPARQGRAAPRRAAPGPSLRADRGRGPGGHRAEHASPRPGACHREEGPRADGAPGHRVRPRARSRRADAGGRPPHRGRSPQRDAAAARTPGASSRTTGCPSSAGSGRGRAALPDARAGTRSALRRAEPGGRRWAGRRRPPAGRRAGRRRGARLGPGIHRPGARGGSASPAAARARPGPPDPRGGAGRRAGPARAGAGPQPVRGPRGPQCPAGAALLRPLARGVHRAGGALPAAPLRGW